VPAVAQKVLYQESSRGSYGDEERTMMLDDGTIVPAQPQELSLGQAMVRLEVAFEAGR
jgi:hypothetical protein